MSNSETGGRAKLEWCKHIYWCDSYHEWRHESKYGLTMPRDIWKFVQLAESQDLKPEESKDDLSQT